MRTAPRTKCGFPYVKTFSSLFASLMLSGLALGLMSGKSLAQGESNALRSFDAAYFTDIAPRTALDMIRRVPGFQLSGGGTERGLGQGGANVLLNGQQITGKGDNAEAQIARISAANVFRIDILDGASLNISGLSGQVANLIVEKSGISGTYEWQPEFRPNVDSNLLRFNVTVTGETGDLAYSAEVRSRAFRDRSYGPERQISGDGVLQQTLDEEDFRSGDRPGAAVNLTWKPREDHIGNLNLDYNEFNFGRRQETSIDPSDLETPPSQTAFTASEDEWTGQIDGDYELPFLAGRLKLIGLARQEHSPTTSTFSELSDADIITSQSRFLQVADESEIIGRSEYSWHSSGGKNWQIAAEGAFNVLDVNSEFLDFIDPPELSFTRVEELRSEVSLTHSRALSSKIDAQLSLGGEYSEISQDVLTREFIRPKGFLSLTYKPDIRLNVRARIEREVGQLNFFDFVSSVDLDNAENSVGNAQLVPSQSWTGEVEFDQQLGGGNSAKLRFYGELISDLVDRIPVGIDGDAVGNIDSANRYGIELNTTLKGETLGLPGLELSSLFVIGDSNVDDPLGSFSRRLNRDRKWRSRQFLRYDIPDTKWALGAFGYYEKNAPVYRLSTISTTQRNQPFTAIFVEHKDIFGLKVQVNLRNLLSSDEDVTRRIFDQRRDIGTLETIEFRERQQDTHLRITVSGTF